MKTVRGWSTATLIAREEVFDGLISKAVRMTLRPIALRLNEIVVAAVTLSDSSSDPHPIITTTAAGQITALWDGYVDQELAPYLQQTFLDSAAQVLTGMESALDDSIPKITDSYAQAYLANATNNLKGISDALWEAVRTELQLGLDDGEGTQQLAARVRKITGVTPAHARSIARTEVHNAAEAGSLAQVQLAGFSDAECSKRWLGTNDDRTREAHLKAHGQTVGINQPFIVMNEGLQRPGDPLASAANVIQCRCTMEYLFHDDDDVVTAASNPDWDPLEHPKGPDGRFIKKGAAGYGIGKLKLKLGGEPDVSDINHQISKLHTKANAAYLNGDDQLADELKAEIKDLVAYVDALPDPLAPDNAINQKNDSLTGDPLMDVLIDQDALAKTTAPKKKSLVGPKIKINTNVIYKTEYEDGAVVAERHLSLPDESFRLTWSAGEKKFLLQKQMNNGNWVTISKYGKGAAYQEFKDQTGWTAPVTSIADKILAKYDPANIVVTEVTDVSNKLVDPHDVSGLLTPSSSIGTVPTYLPDDDFSLWFNKNFTSKTIDDAKDAWNSLSPEQQSQIQKKVDKSVSIGAVGMSNFIDNVLKPGSGAALNVNAIATMNSAMFNDWFFTNFIDHDDMGQAQWNALNPSQQNAISSAADAAVKSIAAHTPKMLIETFTKAQIPDATDDPSIPYPDFDEMHIVALNTWFENLTEEQYGNFEEWEQEGIWDAAKHADEENNNQKPLNALQSLTGQFFHGGPKSTLPDFDSMDATDKFVWFDQLKQEDWNNLSGDEVGVVVGEAAKLNAVGLPAPFKKVSSFVDSAKTAPDVDDPDTSLDDPIEFTPSPVGVTQIDSMNADQFKSYAGALVGPGSDPSDLFWDTAEKLGITPWAEALVKMQSPHHSPLTVKGQPVSVTVPAKLNLNGLTPEESWQAVHEYAVANVKPAHDVGVPNANVDPTLFATLSKGSAGTLQDQMLKTAGKSWTPAELTAVQQYTTKVGYQTTNAVLRNDQKRMKTFSSAQLADGVKRAIDLQNAMTPLTASVILHRGTGAQAFGFSTKSVDTAKLKALEGKVIKDRGFTSTSVVSPKGKVSFDYASKPIKIIVRAPKGTPALYVSSATPGWTTENEMILGAGSNFRIDEVREATSADKSTYGDGIQQVVIMTVVPDDGTPTDQLKKGAKVKTPSGTKVTPAPVATSPTPSIAVVPSANGGLKPIKLNTKTIHSIDYAPNTIVAVRVAPLAPGGSPVAQRLIWSGKQKKFIHQVATSGGVSGWATHGVHSKKSAYDTFKGDANWFTSPVGQNVATTSELATPDNVAASLGLPIVAPVVTVPNAPVTATPPQSVGDIIGAHGTMILGTMTESQVESFYKSFKTTSGFGTMMLSKPSETVFNGVAAAVAKWNKDNEYKPINHLQALKLIDKHAAEKLGVANTNAYEKKIVDWLQTSDGLGKAPALIKAADAAAIAKPVSSTSAVGSLPHLVAQIPSAYDIGKLDENATSFPNMSPAQAAAMNTAMRKKHPITGAQASAITYYTGSGSGPINRMLRKPHDNVYSSQTVNNAKLIQEAMYPIPKSITVHRGSDTMGNAIVNTMTLDQVKQFEGKTFTDGSFFSTSVGNKAAFDGKKFQMHIELPAGTPAAYVKSISGVPSENELLLAAGLHYQIVSVSKIGYQYHVNLRVVNPK